MKKKESINVGAELTTEQVMDRIAKNFQQLLKDVRYHNYNSGCHLTQEDCEEIAAVVRYKAILAASRYDPSKSIRTWMNAIAKNEVKKALKYRGRKARLSVTYVDESDEDGAYCEQLRLMHLRMSDETDPSNRLSTPEMVKAHRDGLEALKGALMTLSTRDRDVVKMLMDDVSGREMAKRLHLKESAQRKLVADVRKRLRKRIESARLTHVDSETLLREILILCEELG